MTWNLRHYYSSPRYCLLFSVWKAQWSGLRLGLGSRRRFGNDSAHSSTRRCGGGAELARSSERAGNLYLWAENVSKLHFHSVTIEFLSNPVSQSKASCFSIWPGSGSPDGLQETSWRDINPGGWRSWPSWKYVGGVRICFDPLKCHVQNCCWITVQVSRHQGWKTCVKNGQ